MSQLHKKFPRASFFYVMDNCPAAWGLAQKSGDEPPTIFSDRGTKIHGVLSRTVPITAVEPDEADLAGDLETQSLDFGRQWLGGDVASETRSEGRLWLRHGLRLIYSGQPDKWTVSGRRVLLEDFKTGWHPLDAYVATNAQLRAYVPLIDDCLKGDLDEVTAVIHKPGKKSPPAIFGREEIDASRFWALALVDRSIQAGAKKPVRGEWCRYCPGKVLCPAWKQEIEDVASLSSAIVADIPDSALREMAPKLAIARLVIEKLEARLYDRVKSHPEHFPDWRFEAGDERREIRDMGLFYDVLVTQGGLRLDDFLSVVRVNFTELERKWKIAKKLTGTSAKRDLEKVLEGILVHKRTRDRLIHDPQQKEFNLDGGQMLSDAEAKEVPGSAENLEGNLIPFKPEDQDSGASVQQEG